MLISVSLKHELAIEVAEPSQRSQTVAHLFA